METRQTKFKFEIDETIVFQKQNGSYTTHKINDRWHRYHF